MADDPLPPRVVLVTGASTFLGGHLVARLARDPGIEHIIAVDSRRPTREMTELMGRAEFVRVDIRRPTIGTVIGSCGADTVVHAATSVMDTVPHTPAIKELDVMGAMQVCAAVARTPSVRRLVVRSTGMVYGSSAADPAHFAEETRARVDPTDGYGRDLIDVESYARKLSRRRRDVDVTILRPAAILGPTVATRMSTYLSSPIIPAVIGYQPRLQFLHEDDAVAALEHATLLGRAGTFNLAADGVVTLRQAIRRAGRIEVPVPSNLLGSVAGVFRTMRVAAMHGDQASYLTYGRVLDTTRMRSELGFAPGYTNLETLDDFIARRPVEPVVSAAAWHRLERRITETARALA